MAWTLVYDDMVPRDGQVIDVTADDGSTYVTCYVTVDDSSIEPHGKAHIYQGNVSPTPSDPPEEASDLYHDGSGPTLYTISGDANVQGPLVNGGYTKDTLKRLTLVVWAGYVDDKSGDFVTKIARPRTLWGHKTD